jgi:hypothetical protein
MLVADACNGLVDERLPEAAVTCRLVSRVDAGFVDS